MIYYLVCSIGRGFGLEVKGSTVGSNGLADQRMHILEKRKCAGSELFVLGMSLAQ
jgi:hypothetical protein